MTIKTILTSLRGDETDSRCLAVAGGFTQRFHAHLVALHLEPDPATAMSSMMFDLGGGAGFIEDLVNSMEKENETRRTKVKKAYSDWRAAASIPEATRPGETPNESACLVFKTGTEQSIQDFALMADLVVTTLAETDVGDNNIELEVALIDAGRPIIALPRSWAPVRDDAPIVVAWNGSAESAHALSAALPILQDASQVHVLRAGRPDNAGGLEGIANYLAWHGIRVSTEELGSNGDPEELIASRVAKLGAQMLVMGAYTHSRAREFVFGGVTHHMMKTARVPLLLAH
jgi:nucleotide-binding universal stress UspA family protein